MQDWNNCFQAQSLRRRSRGAMLPYRKMLVALRYESTKEIGRGVEGDLEMVSRSNLFWDISNDYLSWFLLSTLVNAFAVI